ncbi:hypothetical protein LL037_17975 [Clostridium estertheticum]|uniref:Uncharacterized protein n=1 Tax=Clostridium estertheticum TaxID=238834 RepID=A0AA47EKE4_9CLOT|nr:hypothetical protein [Clostridium estertheticum]WAG61526.1 hypothetical protein LL038_04550 [Clostridium estertheticum]WAG64346.1 hypothetical protein LL037_17975 [Clostridium estertheticum]
MKQKEKAVQVCTLCPGATKTNFFAQEGTETPQSAMTAEDVASYAYKQFMKNKDVTVPGFLNRIIIKFPLKLKMRAVAKMKKENVV